MLSFFTKQILLTKYTLVNLSEKTLKNIPSGKE